MTEANGYRLDRPCGGGRQRRVRAAARRRYQARAAERAAELAAALALWRGAALAEFTYQSWAQPEIARPEELRLAALEGRIEADLECGRAAELVGELEAIVQEHPLRERLRGQLMLALYRAGRQAEALDAYVAARTALVDELGIDPGTELQTLHRSILNQDACSPHRPAGRTEVEVRCRRRRSSGAKKSGLDSLSLRRATMFASSPSPDREESARRVSRSRPQGTSRQLRRRRLVRRARADARGRARALGGRLDARRRGRPRGAPRRSTGTARARQLRAGFRRSARRASLLDACSGLAILVTSRERLHLAGEVELALAPLDLSDAANCLLSGPADSVSSSTRRPERLGRLCAPRRLPLAIELAAAGRRCSHRPSCSRGSATGSSCSARGRQDTPDRHRKLVATIEWSYELLRDREREFLEGLAVFAGRSTSPTPRPSSPPSLKLSPPWSTEPGRAEIGRRRPLRVASDGPRLRARPARSTG